MATRALLLMTKPALPGRVKTRLAAALGAETAARLHAAFLADLAARLRAPAAWDLVPCWALEPGETVPAEPPAGRRQRGADLGERLLDAFARLPGHELAAAIGSDQPELGAGTVEAAFAALERGADVVLGPARDGGYYLIALRPARLRRELFEAIPWSTERVLSVTRARCRALGLEVAELEPAEDVDTPDDLERLALRLAGRRGLCPRTEALLVELGRLPRREVACAS